MTNYEISPRHPGAPTDPQAVATLAADIYEMVEKRNVRIAEGILAGYLALTYLTRNCECIGCKCGDKAHERASREMRTGIGDAAIKLFDLELDARDC